MKARSLVVNNSSFIQQGSSIIDLGCGDGATVEFLLTKGFKVTGVDVINKVERLYEYEQFEFIQTNLDKYSWKEYDITICMNVIHFFKNYKELIEKIKKNTTKTVYISVFTENGELDSPRFNFFKKNELKELFHDWKIEFYEEKMSRTATKKEDDTYKMHEVAYLVASR